MNYITITDFMVSDLKLKGNELIIFALIYGFSQDGTSDFHGSLSYIQKRTGLSRPTVVDILSKLTEKGLVEKQKKNSYCIYFTSQETLLQLVKKLNQTSKETLPTTSKETLLNNKYIKEKEIKENNSVFKVIEYLNEKTHSKFRFSSKANRVNICSRIAEGYSVEDLKTVIDVKTKEWLGTEYEKYLCPETLFRESKFERYLNQGLKDKPKCKTHNNKKIENEIFEEG